MRMKNSKIIFATFLIAASTMVVSCGNGNQDQAAMQQMPPVETDFITLQQGSADVENTFPGTIEGQDNVEIKAQVSGYLEAIYVKEGQYVNKGQSLFKIKGDVYNEQVNTSNAALKAALANQANAKLEVEKLRPLVEGKVVSDVQLKTAQANYSAATAQVNQAKSSLGSSKINANFTVIKAPVSGYISRIPNRIGNLITPNDATPLTSLSNITTVNVYFSMNEADFLSFQKGNSSKSTINAELILADGTTYNYKGKVETASGNIDATTGSMQMKAVFQNPNQLLRSGGTAKVVLHSNLNNVLTLPKIAVKDIQDKYFVYKLGAKNTVNMVPIEVSGSSVDNYFVSKGVAKGDKIAINRIESLYEGAAVIVKDAKSTK
jgi:membrane fusion protein (multidrug efflux system)